MAAPMSSSGMTSMTLRTVDSRNASTTRARYWRYLVQSWASGWVTSPPGRPDGDDHLGSGSPGAQASSSSSSVSST
ncbi:hypothetical protein [Ornithinimicrobium kibberense]|uniref:hypothetical protein n=1 Tax=Ornithinimicrobium kibberense TaxID=282060 RepID=UPI0036191952